MKLNKKFILTSFTQLRETSLALPKKKERIYIYIYFNNKLITLTDCIISIIKEFLEKIKYHLQIFQGRKIFLLHNMFKLCYSFSWIMFRAKPH